MEPYCISFIDKLFDSTYSIGKQLLLNTKIYCNRGSKKPSSKSFNNDNVHFKLYVKISSNPFIILS